MLNSQEILELLKNTPQGFLKPEDNLFNVSNTNILKPYKKLGAINSTEYENLNDSSGAELNNSVNDIFCNIMGCSMIFGSVASYQSHYNAMHRFICSECKKSLPTEHLLDLHLMEQHDSYFNARVERGERLYKCYLEECAEIFQNPMERKEHCIKQHKLPSNFRFDQISHKNAPAKVKKPSSTTSPDESMEFVVEQIHLQTQKNQELKTFSFGHQKEKTFRIRNGSKQKQESGKTLENMATLKEVLNSM